MSQAEELLNSASEEIPVHTHPVPDTDTYFVIDPITRKIENTNRKKNVVMQYDHNSERFTFELPRYIDGHDMLECTSVTVNVDNIETGVEEPRINSDAPDMTDLRIHPNDSEKVICSWLISRNSTQLAGILSFHIEFKCVDSNGNVVYEWSTDEYDEIKIKARKKNGEAAVVEHTDLLEQWRARIFGAGDSVMTNIAAEGETQVAAVKAESETQQEAVELKGAQTLDSIPEDYTETNNMADEAVRTKSDAIVCEAAGESITLNDSSDDHIRGLKLFGKSSQVTTTGKNLLDDSKFEETNSQGVLVTRNSDGSFHASGTANTAYVSLVRLGQINMKAGVRYLITGAVSNMSLALRDETAGSVYIDDNGDGASYVPTVDMIAYLNIRVEIGGSINTKFYPMIRLASIEDDTWEPYTGGKPSPNPEYSQEIVSIENPTVCTYGKNLLDVDATLTFTQYIGMDVRIPAGKYILSWDSVVTEYGIGPTIGFSDNNVLVESKHTALPKTITLTKDETKIHFYSDGADYNWSAGKPATINGLMLSVVGGDYESYKPAQTLAVARTLHGIPVTSGGNYTDSDGQQWICDEVDLERGVYVQRTMLVDMGTLDWKYSVTDKRFYIITTSMPTIENDEVVAAISTNYNPITFSSFYRDTTIDGTMARTANYLFVRNLSYTDVGSMKSASSGAMLLYTLATPIETPLTAEEITAFKALRTNYPNTTILNDAGAWMSVKYNADTKSYVENPKILKLVDSNTGVVYELKIVDGNLTVTPV